LSAECRPACARAIRGVYPIADDAPGHRHDLRQVVEALCRSPKATRVGVVQLRFKELRDGDALALAEWTVARAHAADIGVVVNDRFDLAWLAGADGVHLGADDLPVERVPEPVRERLWIGLSTHTEEQVRASRTRPVDYIGFGPVFATGSKVSEYTPRGLPGLARALELACVPVVAIGGIDEKRLPEVAAAGAGGAAMISSIADAADPSGALEQLARAWAQGVELRSG